jgi:hypothetical protein
MSSSSPFISRRWNSSEPPLWEPQIIQTQHSTAPHQKGILEECLSSVLDGVTGQLHALASSHWRKSAWFRCPLHRMLGEYHNAMVKTKPLLPPEIKLAAQHTASHYTNNRYSI